MSRLAQGSGVAPLGLASDGSDDICPVCKSSRYLNPNMKFLVNPECYHKMCESCVDRIFSHGPNACPVAGCRKTLRKHRFRKQTFEDIVVEREVDIRKDVAKVFNRRENEFESLLAYNNYLEEVENITFNLVNNIDVAETERKLSRYREENLQSIKQNTILANDENASLQARQAAAKENARLRREASRREEEEEKREREEGRRQVLDKLATGRGHAAQIADEGERVILKRSSARRAENERQQQTASAEPMGITTGTNGSSGSLVFGGLKKRAAPELEKAYDPFGGFQVKRQYHVLQDRYEWDWLEEARSNLTYTAGGYDIREYCQRALSDAFSGLGVFVGEDLSSTLVVRPANVDTGIKSEDVF